MPTGKTPARISRIRWIVLAAVLAALLRPGAADPAAAAAVEKIQVGPATLWVEMALTLEAQVRGLMHRDHLPWDEGMLFVYEKPQHLSFWMKDTTIPLDIAFISAEGVILEIHSMEPLSERTYRSRAPALYALEVNRGWFRKNGVKVGDRIRIR